MARYSAGAKTGAGSTTLPLISLYAAAGSGAKIREIGLFNTTNTAADFKLVRLSTAGTSTGLTEAKYNPNSPAAACTAVRDHTSTAPTAGDDLGYRAAIGAAVGAGVIWTFGDDGLVLSAGTGNGIGVVVENGTGVALQAYIVWDE